MTNNFSLDEIDKMSIGDINAYNRKVSEKVKEKSKDDSKQPFTPW